jgi:hypothetical protein
LRDWVRFVISVNRSEVNHRNPGATDFNSKLSGLANYAAWIGLLTYRSSRRFAGAVRKCQPELSLAANRVPSCRGIEPTHISRLLVI